MQLRFLMILFSMISYSSVYSQTILGSQIDYKQIDSLEYVVRLALYLDCRDTAISKSGFTLFLSSDSTTNKDTLSPKLYSIEDISDFSDTIPDCFSSGSIGVIEYTFTDTINFITQYSNHISSKRITINFSSDSCLTAENIDCSISSDKRRTYNYAYIYPRSKFSGSFFSDKPNFIYPIHEAVQSSHLADINNGIDSVSYNFSHIYLNDTNTASFCGTYYSYNHPLGVYYPGAFQGPPYHNPQSSPPIGLYLNPKTSQLIYTIVTNYDSEVHCIEATFWKDDSTGNKQVCGVLRRELTQMLVQFENNNLPEHNVINNFNSCTEHGDTNYLYSDDDKFIPYLGASVTADTVSMFWDSAIAHLGFKFNIADSNARLQTAQIISPQHFEGEKEQPYRFTILAKDNRGRKARTSKSVVNIHMHELPQISRSFQNNYCSDLSSVETHLTFSNPFPGSKNFKTSLLDSNGNTLNTNSIVFESSRTTSSQIKSDAIIGDTSGIFIIKTSVYFSYTNCTHTILDTISCSLTSHQKYISDTILLCDGAVDSLLPSDKWLDHKWNGTDTSSLYIADSAGIFFIDFTDSCGFQFRHEFTVLAENSPEFNIDDMIFCDSISEVLIYTDTEDHFILWNDSINSKQFTVYDSGKYHVEIFKRCGEFKKEFQAINNYVDFDIQVDSNHCDSIFYTFIHKHGLNYILIPENLMKLDDSTFYSTDSSAIKLTMRNNCTSKTFTAFNKPTRFPRVQIIEDSLFSCYKQYEFIQANGNYSHNWIWDNQLNTPFLTTDEFGKHYVANTNVCGSASDTVWYIKNVTPEFNIIVIDTICDQLTLELELLKGFNNTIEWHIDGSTYTADKLTFMGEHRVDVSISNACGFDTYTDNYTPIPKVQVLLDSLIIECYSDTVTVFPIVENADTLWWSDNVSTKNRSIDSSGKYYFNAKNTCSISMDSIQVKFDTLAKVNLGNDTIVNLPFTIKLTGSSYAQNNWSTGETSESIAVTDTGVYIISVTSNCGVFRDSISITDTSTVSIRQLNVSELVKVFPNPATDEVSIVSNTKLEQIILHHINGTYETFDNIGLRNYKLKLDSYTSGIYFVEIATENYRTFHKIVIID